MGSVQSRFPDPLLCSEALEVKLLQERVGFALSPPPSLSGCAAMGRDGSHGGSPVMHCLVTTHSFICASKTHCVRPTHEARWGTPAQEGQP